MKKLLVITTQHDTADMLRLRFELDGMEVQSASSMDNALEQIKSNTPDLCIIDVGGVLDDSLKRVEDFIRRAGTDAEKTLLLTQIIPDAKKHPLLHIQHMVKKPYDLTALAKMVTELIRQN